MLLLLLLDVLNGRTNADYVNRWRLFTSIARCLMYGKCGEHTVVNNINSHLHDLLNTISKPIDTIKRNSFHEKVCKEIIVRDYAKMIIVRDYAKMIIVRDYAKMIIVRDYAKMIMKNIHVSSATGCH